MTAIYGLFPNFDSARRAVSALKDSGSRMGFTARRIVVISHEPIEEQSLGLPRERTVMPWLAALGGLVGGSAGYTLVSFTQRTYPLPTGGMPIVSLWPAGVITYEFTMLAAILTTIATFLIATRLPSYRNRIYDTAISDGKILVGLSDSNVQFRDELERVLYDQGAEVVKQFPPVPEVSSLNLNGGLQSESQ